MKLHVPVNVVKIQMAFECAWDNLMCSTKIRVNVNCNVPPLNLRKLNVLILEWNGETVTVSRRWRRQITAVWPIQLKRILECGRECVGQNKARWNVILYQIIVVYGIRMSVYRIPS